ncbi:MAG: maltose acetyltransferase domain-containing protein [Holdemania massiliensis]
MSEQEKMLAEMLYTAQDPELVAAHRRALRLTQRYNATGEDQAEEREALIQELLGSFGEDGVIMPPFRCDYGSQIEIGDHFFANYDCLFLDVCSITIGNHVMLGTAGCCIPQLIRSAVKCDTDWITASRSQSAILLDRR